VLARGYRLIRELHADGRTDLYHTVIAADNARALETLASGRAGLPAYRDLGGFVSPAINLGRRKPPLAAGTSSSRRARGAPRRRRRLPQRARPRSSSRRVPRRRRKRRLAPTEVDRRGDEAPRVAICGQAGAARCASVSRARALSAAMTVVVEVGAPVGVQLADQPVAAREHGAAAIGGAARAGRSGSPTSRARR